MHTAGSNIREQLGKILEENIRLSAGISDEALSALADRIQNAKHVYMAGAGRSGLAMKAFAMRLMHLGLSVYVMGETVTPAIGKNDLLIVASGSGTTRSMVLAAEKAKAAEAMVAAISTQHNSPLAALADTLVVLPAAQKQDFGDQISFQYAGSLFEQAIWMLGDAVFQTLWNTAGTPAEILWKRHANLE